MKTNKKKQKKHTIERKMQISKVDETYCVLRYIIWQVEHTSRQFLNTWCMCVAYLDRITIRHSLYVGI
jgi:hypothetical protein